MQYMLALYTRHRISKRFGVNGYGTVLRHGPMPPADNGAVLTESIVPSPPMQYMLPLYATHDSSIALLVHVVVGIMLLVDDTRSIVLVVLGVVVVVVTAHTYEYDGSGEVVRQAPNAPVDSMFAAYVTLLPPPPQYM
jgi:hypothetical protein